MIARKSAGRRIAAMAMIAAALFLAAPAAAAPVAEPDMQTLPADLAGALEEYHRATVNNDTRTLAALVTEDYVLVNSDASVQGKASYLADFAVPGFRVDPYEVEPLTYQVWDAAALTAWTFKLGWTQDGRHQSRTLRIAHFWVNRDGRWRIAYTQLTRVPE